MLPEQQGNPAVPVVGHRVAGEPVCAPLPALGTLHDIEGT